MTGTKKVQFPVLVEEDEDGFFVVECPFSRDAIRKAKRSMRRCRTYVK
jgi:hypothetical protein